VVEAEINRAYAQVLLPANSEYNEMSFKPFLVHQTKILMGANATLALANLIESSDGT